MSELEDFLGRVGAWPGGGDDTPGYVNLHWMDKDKPQFRMMGKPYRDIDSFIWMLNYLAAQGGRLDFYYCMTRQALSKTNKQGKPAAVRKAEHALASRCLWIDIDVKPAEPDKAYANIGDAYRALFRFCEVSKLPFPNVVVESGGGVHAYWVFDHQLPIGEWQWLAEALVAAIKHHSLKCDSGCTTDAARVLRLPGTLNHKTTPPKPTRMKRNEPDFTQAEITVLLTPYANAADHGVRVSDGLGGAARAAGGGANTAAPRHEKAVPLAAAVGWVKPNLPAGFTMERASDGIPEREFQPLDPRPIVAGCAFIRTAYKTGGRKYDQEQWRYTTLLATALEKGHQLAHAMANKHPGYTVESTDAMWTRCEEDVANNPKLAWVSCRQISHGCGDCAACPHFSAGRSPLNIALGVVPQRVPNIPGQQATGASNTNGNMGPAGSMAGSVPPGGGTAPPSAAGVTSPPDMFLPAGYVLNAAGLICKTVIEGKGEEAHEVHTPLFTRPLSEPWAQNTPRGLHFMTEAGMGTATRKVFIEGSAMVSTNRLEDLMEQHVSLNLPFLRTCVEDFTVGWLNTIEKMKGSVIARPFGWIADRGVPNSAFVYDGRLWRADGTSDPAGYVEAAMRRVYEPTGSAVPWIKAAHEFVFKQHRADLEVLLASAFAAPLMVHTGQHGGLLAAYGESAAGKTSTLTIAQAVWSHPILTKEVLSTTTNSAVDKMGKLGNLPVYWDEIRDRNDQRRLTDAAFQLVQGVDKGRMLDGMTQQQRQSWDTLLISGSNLELWDFITSVQKTTNAGLNRVFEYKVQKLPMHGSNVDMDMYIGELTHNYGCVGLIYAKRLAELNAGLKQRVTDKMKTFGDLAKDPKEEQLNASARIWGAICGSILVGAEIANDLGVTSFDIAMMQDFLVKTCKGLMVKMASEANDASLTVNIEDTLTAYLRYRSDATIFTDTCTWTRQDAHKRVQLLSPTPPLTQTKIYVQFVKDDNVVRIVRNDFTAWLIAQENHGRSGVLEGIEREYGLDCPSGKIGANTSYRQGKERLLQINLKPNTWLWEMIPGNISDDDQEPAPPTPADGGILPKDHAALHEQEAANNAAAHAMAGEKA